MKNLGFALKIGGGFALLLALCALVALAGFNGCRQITTTIGGMTSAKDITISSLESRREEKNFILRGDPSYIDSVSAAVKRLDGSVAILRAAPLDASQKKLVESISQANRAYQSAFTTYVQTAGDVSTAATAWKGLGDQVAADVVQAGGETERRFMLLQLAGVYFLKDRTDARLKDFHDAAAVAAPLVDRWAAGR
ncbi:MAG TPA: hypothetical protein VFI08_13075, partial [Spirochaetia bacterium]|nr:hypothetical protein [Spirochaetia bacterium]